MTVTKIKYTVLKTYYNKLGKINPIDGFTSDLQNKINEILKPFIDKYTESVRGKINLDSDDEINLDSDDEDIGSLEKAGEALSSISLSSKLLIKDSPFVYTILLDDDFNINVVIITRLTNSEPVTFNEVKEKAVRYDLSKLGKVISFCLDSGRTGWTKKFALVDDIKIENNKTLELINSLMEDPNLIKILGNMLSGGSVYIDPLSEQIKQDLIKLSKKIDNLKLSKIDNLKL